MPMPASGAVQPGLQVLEDDAGVAGGDVEALDRRAPTALTVCRRPQKVPSRPRKMSRLTR